ncbi:MAG: sigma-70 family RNA polymerase sigma factor [Clostridia bacterium]|nr:sigma-70 family RNA polymerase sigma factor [Clostridia bacterium]
MKNKDILNNYISKNELEVEKLINDYYNYIYLVVKNMSSIAITDEDIEEILSDTFFAIWKNYRKLNKSTNIKAYLIGTAKNITRNKYRETVMNLSIAEYEENILDDFSIEDFTEEKEKINEVKKIISSLSEEEYTIFVCFYYDGMKVKEIAKKLNLTASNVKVKLHRIRNLIRDNLKNGGYGYEK